MKLNGKSRLSVFMGFSTSEGPATIFRLAKAHPITTGIIMCTGIGLLVLFAVFLKNRRVYGVIHLLKRQESEGGAYNALRMMAISSSSRKPLINGCIKALNSKSNIIRCRAAYWLGESIDKRAVEPLIKVLGDENNAAQARDAAAKALGKIKDTRAVEPLIKALEYDNDVRANAAEALGRIKDPRAVEPLIRMLRDESWFVRDFVARVLGKIKDTRAVEPLIEAVGDQVLSVQKSALFALKNMDDPRAKAIVWKYGDRV